MRILLLALSALPLFGQANLDFLNHNRPVLDAHNCYPYKGDFRDRIDRALQTGFPVGIEQDLGWAVDPATGKGRPVVTHDAKTTGSEPSLRDYFFERVRPIVEKALADNDRARWPIIVVHFDFKSVQTELLHAVWDLLGEYQGWITTAAQTARNRSTLKPPTAGALHAFAIAAGSAGVHGNRPTSATGTKYHHGPGRWWSGRAKRSMCSYTKKK